MQASEVVRRLGGVARLQDVLPHTTRHSVRNALNEGSLRRVTHGTYALPELPDTHAAAVAGQGVISHRSAARHWRLAELTPSTAVHVTVPRQARPSPQEQVQFHFHDLDPTEVTRGLITTAARTIVDCTATEPFAEALALADSALRMGLVTRRELVTKTPRRGAEGIRRVARWADGRAMNPFESGLRAIVLDAGLTGFEPQSPVTLKTFTAHVDLGDPRLRIALEADSFAHHGSRAALARDCQRYDELVRAGWLVLRFSWEHVMFEQEWVAQVVLDTVKHRHNSRQLGSQSRSSA